MRNTWLIIKREYLERVRTRSFIVLTLLLPAIVGGAFILPMKIATMKSGNKAPHLVVVTSSPQLGELVRTQLLAKDESGEDDEESSENRSTSEENASADVRYVLDIDTNPSESERTSLRGKITTGEIDGYIWLSDDAIARRKVIYSGHNATDFFGKSRVSLALARAIAEQRLA